MVVGDLYDQRHDIMSRPQVAQPAKLVISILLNDLTLLAEVSAALSSTFGPVDITSGWFDFNYTDYYRDEMGSPLRRRMFAFRQLVAQEDLSAIKLHTNALEAVYTLSGRRRVNIDPGYLLYERFVLATGKNYTHRIYIGQGIYADLTLIFQKGRYRPLPWTYPDYASHEIGDFLMHVRTQYASDIKSA